MRICVPICGEERVVEKFALIPVYASNEWRWMEKVKVHQTWHGLHWSNDWFED